jgi:hypothetical protein
MLAGCKVRMRGVHLIGADVEAIILHEGRRTSHGMAECFVKKGARSNGKLGVGAEPRLV